MRYLIFFLSILILSSCGTQQSNQDNLGLQIDIYNKDLTLEKYKQIIIEYADNASYPSLKNK